MNQEVVARPLPDHSEIIYECFRELAILQRTFETLLRDAGLLVLQTGSLTCAADPLRLEMELAADIVSIYRKSGQGVQRAREVDHFSRTAVCTRHKHKQVYIG